MKKLNVRSILFYLIFLIGLGVLSYPYLSDLYYRYEASSEIGNFDQERQKLLPEDIQKRLELAKAFNDSLNNNIVNDPWIEDLKARGKAEYARMLEINEKIGYVQVPKIDVNLPIFAGTIEDVLQKGVGHLEGTSLPVGGESTHAVLTAHSGLPKAKLFTDLGQLVIGDRFYVHNVGETLAYEVDQILVVTPENFEPLLIEKGKDYVTLLTCTPYMINTHRLLVRGHRIPYDVTIAQKDISDAQRDIYLRYALYAVILLVIILFIILMTRRRKKKDETQKN